MKIEPLPGETPLQALIRQQNAGPMFVWDEDDVEPITDEEASAGMRDAIVKARENGWIPADDPGCGCLTCRLFRQWLDG